VIVFSINFTSIAFGMFNFRPVLIVAVSGAIFCFFIAYVIPYAIHFSCLYRRECRNEKQLEKYVDPE
jgi:hypothetical protein